MSKFNREVIIRNIEGSGLIHSTLAHNSIIFEDLTIRNISIYEQNAFFRQIHNVENDQIIQRNFRLLNIIIQDLNEISFNSSNLSESKGLLFQIEGFTNYNIENLTLNNADLKSKV